MPRNLLTSERGNNEKRTDMIFAAIALALTVLLIVLLVRYSNLKSENEKLTQNYSSVTEELVNAKKEKSELESKVDGTTREIQELNQRIAALEGEK